MSLLKQQINTLKEEFLHSKSSGDSKNIIDDCEDLHKRFKPVSENLDLLISSIDVLKSLPHNAPESVLLSDELIDNCKLNIKILNKLILEWNSKKTNILQTDLVDDAYKSLYALEKELAIKVNSSWRSWIEKLEESFRVEDFLLDSQRGIPGLSDIHNKYIELRKIFRAESKNLPKNIWSIQNLERVSVDMQDLSKQMQQDLPVDIVDFFKHINNNNGQAPLSLLTPNVLDWFKEHNQLGGFTIHRKLY